MPTHPVPPIPATCAHRPTVGGRVAPYINVHLADGGVDFRRQHRTRVEEVLERRWCQVCATPLRHPIVLLGGPHALKQLLFKEPPLHPECAVYTTRACPMVAGQLTEFAHGLSVAETRRGKKCFEPGCGCAGWVSTDPGGDRGPAHPWYAVYARNYRVVDGTDGQVLGALVLPAEVLRVRLVSRPGEGRCWQDAPDALADYEPPILSLPPRPA